MKTIYIVMVQCCDWPENGGGIYGPYEAYEDKTIAQNAADLFAYKMNAEESQPDGHYQGYVEEIKLYEREN